MKYTQEQPIQRWFVVNMCNRWNDTKLSRSVKPQRSFHSFAEACAYAIEMAKQHSRGDYAVFECIGRYVSDAKNPPGKPGFSKLRSVSLAA